MKRIVVTPAGRKRYLEVLFEHVKREYNSGGFDEWHLWLNTNNHSDIEYCKKLANNNEWIKVDEVPGLTQVSISSLNIHKFFKYACEKDTVYVRLDDDIVFVEKGFFSKIFKFRIDHPEPFLVYGNIINNAFISHYHQANNLVNYHAKVNPECLDPTGWKDPIFAERIHRSFIEDVKSGNIDKWHNSFSEIVCSRFERVSINCISWLGATFAEFNGQVGENEEQWLSVVKPQEINKPNMIYSGAIVAHFAFYTQRAYVDSTNILEEYRKLIDY